MLLILGVDVNEKILAAIDLNSSTLTTLDLSGCYQFDRLDNSELELFKTVIGKCTLLREANFNWTGLNQDSISYMCENLTTKIEKLSLENLSIFDEQLEKLLTRCKSIQELDLRHTNISEISVNAIKNHLPETLKKLALPDTLHYTSIKILEEMPKLEYLWLILAPCEYKGHPWETPPRPEDYEEYQASLEKLLPKVKINFPIQTPYVPPKGPRMANDFTSHLTKVCCFKPMQKNKSASNVLKRKICEKDSKPSHKRQGK